MGTIGGDGKKAKSERANEEGDALVHDRPIVCILEDVPTKAAPNQEAPPAAAAAASRANRKMFRIIRSRGKALASGGFGVTIATGSSSSSGGEPGEEDSDNDSECDENDGVPTTTTPTTTTDSKSSTIESSSNPTVSDANTTSTQILEPETKNAQSKPSTTTTTAKSPEYLFVEEALFLHEKGLLRALLPSSSSSKDVNETNSEEATAEASKPSTTVAAASEAENDDISATRLPLHATPLDTSQLYQLLVPLGISLPIYRVYSHLRSQDFRVLRHDPDRYDILCLQSDNAEERKMRAIELKTQQRQQHETKNQEATAAAAPSQPILPNHDKTDTAGDSGGGEPEEGPSLLLPPPRTNHLRKKYLRLRRRVRESIQNAPPPSIPDPRRHNRRSNDENDDDGSSDNRLGICWDAYHPNSNFGKTHPGLPDFHVTVTYFNVPVATFSELKSLLKKCSGIPLKVATVSDSGTVVMFGVTDYGIPPLATKQSTDGTTMV